MASVRRDSPMTANASKSTKSATRVLDADLVVISVVSVVCLAFVIVPQISGSSVRPVIEIALLLFVPGYVLLAAIFPRKTDLSGFERIALSFGLSIAIVPLLAFGLTSTVWGVGAESITIVVILFIFASSAAAYARRRLLPIRERFSVRFEAFAPFMRTLVQPPRSRSHSILLILLVSAILFSASALAYAFLTPEPRESYTEFYLLGPGGAMQGYPANLTLGHTQLVTVGIANHEGTDITYTLLAALNDSTRSTVLYSGNVTVANGQIVRQTIALKPNRTGSNERIDFMLYRDSDLTSPYRQTYLLTNVTK
jgi:uncharacterized membrane protein